MRTFSSNGRWEISWWYWLTMKNTYYWSYYQSKVGVIMTFDFSHFDKPSLDIEEKKNMIWILNRLLILSQWIFRSNIPMKTELRLCKYLADQYSFNSKSVEDIVAQSLFLFVLTVSTNPWISKHTGEISRGRFSWVRIYNCDIKT